MAHWEISNKKKKLMEEKRNKRGKTFRKQTPNYVHPAFSVITMNANRLS